MNNTAIVEVFYEDEFVKYYTVRKETDGEKAMLTETDKFYEKFDNEEHPYFREFDTIVRVIDAIGSSRCGAECCLFRPEDEAEALPPGRGAADRVLEIKIILHSQLRLYCVRLTDEVVVLLNGDVKTKDGALHCPNVKEHFRFAQSVARGLRTLLSDGDIYIEGKEIINTTVGKDILLYY